VPPDFGPSFGVTSVTAGSGRPNTRSCSRPAETPLTPPSCATPTGLLLHTPVPHGSGPVLVPRPSSPVSLSPHVSTVPSLRSAISCSPPAAPAAISLNPLTDTGFFAQGFGGSSPHVSGPVLVPSPSSPR